MAGLTISEDASFTDARSCLTLLTSLLAIFMPTAPAIPIKTRTQAAIIKAIRSLRCFYVSCENYGDDGVRGEHGIHFHIRSHRRFLLSQKIILPLSSPCYFIINIGVLLPKCLV